MGVGPDDIEHQQEGKYNNAFDDPKEIPNFVSVPVYGISSPAFKTENWLTQFPPGTILCILCAQSPVLQHFSLCRIKLIQYEYKTRHDVDVSKIDDVDLEDELV